MLRKRVNTNVVAASGLYLRRLLCPTENLPGQILFHILSVLLKKHSKEVQMKTLVIGVGGMTNGGKSTLARSLQQQIPNSCVIAQDTFFKDDIVVPVDGRGFKQYDMLDALHMDKMMSQVDSWLRDPVSFLGEQALAVDSKEDVFVLIVEGFLIFNHKPLNQLFHKRYFMEIPYDVCKQRRSSRVYTPPDPPGYFDGHVWPMYVKNRQEMERDVPVIALLDGLKSKEELLASVYEDVCREIQKIKDEHVAE